MNDEFALAPPVTIKLSIPFSFADSTAFSGLEALVYPSTGSKLSLFVSIMRSALMSRNPFSSHFLTAS